MKLLHLIAGLIFLVSAAAKAAPTVTGNTISWPDDGWYQVQIVTDEAITEVCAGTRSCIVGQGTFIVINHTTGERFENIVVGGDSSPVFERTINPVDVVVSGGFTLRSGVSLTTQLFLDKDEEGNIDKFWVRVEDNPGTVVSLGSDATDENTGAASVSTTVYIKYFPMSRYAEIRESLMGIKTFGVVNPYIDGGIICDAPNLAIRFGTSRVKLAYNCGSDGPNADSATLQSAELLTRLANETVETADLRAKLDD